MVLNQPKKHYSCWVGWLAGLRGNNATQPQLNQTEVKWGPNPSQSFLFVPLMLSSSTPTGVFS